MKKSLLITAALLVGAASFAQNGRQGFVNRPIKATAEYKVDNDAFPLAGTKIIGSSSTQPQQANAACTPIWLTSCVNAFAVGGGVTTYQQNCLSYNTDLNQVVWTGRVSADWAFPGKTSGAIQSTWIDVATGNKDSMIIYRDSANTRGARYPGGTMFNPTGNTLVSGSQLMGSGSTTSGSGWIGAWYANRQPSGTYTATNIPNQVNFSAVGTAPFGNLGNSLTNCGFLNLDMQQVGQTVLVGGALFDITATTEVKGGVVAKATYSGGSFTWSADSVVPGFLSTPQGLISDGLGGRIAFDPTGMIGYLVFNGRLSTNYGTNADSSMMPIVYKSTDGGVTWNGPMLSGYDWTVCHPEILKNVGALLGGQAVHPTPNTQHGIDLTVDANGILHYVTTITLPWKDGVYAGGGHDSLQYTYVYKWDYVNNHPIIWDLMTDGTTGYGWKTLMVDSILTSYMGGDPANDSTAAFNAWQNTATFLPYGAHLTVSRSSDGTKVFYGWGDTDPNVTGTAYNTQPDMIMKAYDVNAQTVSATTNITNGIGTCFFSYLSDVSYFDAGMSMWVVPFVYTVGRTQASPGVYVGTAAVDQYYGNCAMFDATTIANPAVVNNCAIIGIKNYTNNHTVTVGNFPNPFSNVTNIVVSLTESKPLDLKVYDAIGSLVYSKKMVGNAGENTFVFDGSTLSAGVYHYTVSAGYEKVSKKMVIQK